VLPPGELNGVIPQQLAVSSENFTAIALTVLSQFLMVIKFRNYKVTIVVTNRDDQQQYLTGC